MTLKEARLNKGLTQKQLGDLVGVKYQTIQRYESGECSVNNMTLELAMRFCRALDITPYDLDNNKSLE